MRWRSSRACADGRHLPARRADRARADRVVDGAGDAARGAGRGNHRSCAQRRNPCRRAGTRARGRPPRDGRRRRCGGRSGRALRARGRNGGRRARDCPASCPRRHCDGCGVCQAGCDRFGCTASARRQSFRSRPPAGRDRAFRPAFGFCGTVRQPLVHSDPARRVRSRRIGAPGRRRSTSPPAPTPSAHSGCATGSSPPSSRISASMSIAPRLPISPGPTRTPSCAIAATARMPRPSFCARAPPPTGSPRAACCPCSSISPAMAAP